MLPVARVTVACLYAAFFFRYYWYVVIYILAKKKETQCFYRPIEIDLNF